MPESSAALFLDEVGDSAVVGIVSAYGDHLIEVS
jgi:hypothetical protein